MLTGMLTGAGIAAAFVFAAVLATNAAARILVAELDHLEQEALEARSRELSGLAFGLLSAILAAAIVLAWVVLTLGAPELVTRQDTGAMWSCAVALTAAATPRSRKRLTGLPWARWMFR